MDIKWVPLVGKTGYILAAGALIPTYILNDREIVLVDSGLHYDPGLVSFIRAVGVSVYAVLQTHLHEDHVANNRILSSSTGSGPGSSRTPKRSKWCTLRATSGETGVN